MWDCVIFVYSFICAMLRFCLYIWGNLQNISVIMAVYELYVQTQWATSLYCGHFLSWILFASLLKWNFHWHWS